MEESIPKYSKNPFKARIIERYLKGKEGDIIELQELSQITGLNVESKDLRQIERKARYAANDLGVVWDWVDREDKVLCLGADGVIDISRKARNAIRRKAKRALKWKQNVYNKCPEEKKDRLVAMMTIDYMTIKTNSSRSENKLTGNVKNYELDFDINKTIKLFEKNGKEID